MDNGTTKDIFTSSRESIVANDPLFNNFLSELKKLFLQVIDEWDDFRRKALDTGDPDNNKIKPQQRKAEELFNVTLEDMESEEKFIKKGGVVEQWAQGLAHESQFNIPSYTECFISENLLRDYIKYTAMPLSPEAEKEASKWRGREADSKEAANISYSIRLYDEDLYYLDMAQLANLVDKAKTNKNAGISRSAVVYKPLRDAVGHTSIITDAAKQQLSLMYENIKARLAELLHDIQI